MIDSLLGKKYQRALVDPLSSSLEHVAPHKVTALSCITGVLVWPLLYLQMPIIACILLLISGYLDTLDGSIARRFGKSTSPGAVFDIVSDRLVEFSVIIGLYSMDPTTRAFPCLLMLGSVLLCITSFLVVGITTPNESEKGFYYSPGIIERVEAFIFWIAMMFFPSFFDFLAYGFTFAVLVTTVIRLKQFHSVVLSQKIKKT